MGTNLSPGTTPTLVPYPTIINRENEDEEQASERHSLFPKYRIKQRINKAGEQAEW